jgi:mannitol/fructose-specific phosphotransferase system IIA component
MADVMLTRAGVRVGLTARDRTDAIQQAGELLVDIGAVEPPYIEAMHVREKVLSSYVGEAFALPHGTDESREYVTRSSVVFLQFPKGIDWEGEEVRACIGIAAQSNEHTDVMARLANVLLDADKAELLRSTTNPEEVVEILEPERSDAEA